MKKVEELQEAQRKANGVPEYPVVEKKPEEHIRFVFICLRLAVRF